MSPICQTFVQNAWRKDLCSNCFKSKEEHECSGKDYDSTSRRECGVDYKSSLTKRYVGVAGRSTMYSRNYYGKNTWNPVMLDNSSNESRILKSPGLIKGMDSFIKLENEKNRTISDFSNELEIEKTSLSTVPLSKNIPSDSWIISQIIGDARDYDNSIKRNLEKQHGDSCSDLGSDVSHDISGSSGNNSCSGIDLRDGDSDSNSLKSEPDSAHEDEPSIQSILKIHHESSLHKSLKMGISFKSEDDVIGFGGDVDYSDDDYSDDDDDDDVSVSSSDLSPEERELKHVTEINTNFNSENENLEKDPSYVNCTEPSSLTSSSVSHLFLRSTSINDSKQDISSTEVPSLRQEGKVKLKRSPPIGGVKPQIKANLNISSPVLSSASSNDAEDIPMRGIKPKYVSRDEEMKENSGYEEVYEQEHISLTDTSFSKVTSIDDISLKVTSIDDLSPKVTSVDDISLKVTSVDDISPKVTSIDDISPKVTSLIDISPKVASIDDISPKVTSIDDISPKVTSIDDISPKVTSIDDMSPKVTSIDDMSPKVTSIDDISHKVTSIDDISPNVTFIDGLSNKATSIDYILPNIASIDAISPKITSVDDTKITAVGNISSKTISVDNISIENKYVADTSIPTVCELLPQNSISKQDIVQKSSITSNIDDLDGKKSSKFTDEKSAAAIEIISNLSGSVLSSDDIVSDFAIMEHSDKINSNSVSDVCAVISETKFTLCNTKMPKTVNQFAGTDKGNESTPHKVNALKSNQSFISDQNNVDLSVKSAKVNRFVLNHSNKPNRFVKKLDKGYLSDGLSENRSVYDTENSKLIFDQLQTPVAPLNNINIQRRSSFMESQLAGTVYTGTLDPQLIDANYNNSNESCEKDVIQAPAKSTNYTSSSSSSNFLKQRDIDHMPIANVSTIIQRVNVPEDADKSEPKDNVKLELTAAVIEKQNSKSCENIVDSAVCILNKRCSSSSSLSTFGTPMTPTQVPQSSFLHSGIVRPVNDTNEVNSVIYSTPDFLRGIRNIEKEPTVTAGIQKASLYASTSCLKGLPGAKPATTPKPVMLKDRPRIPNKLGISSSRIYQTPVPITKSLSENVYSSAVLTTPNRPISSVHSSISHLDSDISETNICKSHSSLERRKPPPTNQAPEIPKIISNCKENVYDVPFTVGSPTSSTVSAPSPTSSSSGYSTTSNNSQLEINNEIELTPKKLSDEERIIPSTFNSEVTKAECLTVSTLSTTASPTVNLSKNKQNYSHYKSTFEANRNLLSANLCFYSDTQNLKPSTTQASEQPKFSTDDCVAISGSESTCLTLETAVPDTVEQSSQSTLAHSNALNAVNLQNYNTQHSYVNLQPYENHEIDSYSSFTDDFDDDDDDDDLTTNKQFATTQANDVNSLRRTERSSSSAPTFRNSVGMINYPSMHGSEFGSCDVLEGKSKPPAVRSHSVPRAVESSVKSSIFGKTKGESSSKFGFVKAGFFRPSSPPAVSRKLSSERGREQTKKSNTGFSLRKLLRLGSTDKQKYPKEHKSLKEVERESQREARKLQLQIIHPLDYNTNGVEVIARPEKRSPAYDIYGSPFQELSQQPNINDLANQNFDPPTVDHFHPKETYLVSLMQPQNLKKGDKMGKPTKKNSFLRKRRKTTERKESIKIETRPVVTYVRNPSSSTNNINSVSSSLSDYARCNNISHNVANSVSTSETTSIIASNAQLTTINLGFNSEGRPRPPPPPRKTSLETANHEVFLIPTNPPPLSVNASQDVFSATISQRSEGDTSSLSSNSSLTRPSRPPPPRRTPSAASSTRVGGCRLPAGRDNVYANLGNARASFTPCKPGRSASIRDEEKEKRRAPNPPNSQNEVVNSRIAKGPAPPTPHNDYAIHDHDYEYISDNSPEKNVNLKTENLATSTLPSRQKTKASEGRRTNTITNLSLEDQYGAVVNANLEALSNMLDQVCKQTESHADKKTVQNIRGFVDINLISTDPVSCAPRLFYSATFGREKLTVMVTPETKVEVDTLLMPSPIITFREDISSSLLNIRKLADKQIMTSSTIWILPRLSLYSLAEFTKTLKRLLQEEPLEWEKRVCFFLLQMVTALKQLQAKGIEESSLSHYLIINNMEEDASPRLLMASPTTVGDIASANDSYWPLCQCAAAATQLLLGHSQPLEAAMKGPVLAPPFTPSPHAFSSLVTTLREERASSLTKAKCILEAMLFGPVNLNVSREPNMDITIQKWLDLERATVLHSLVREQSSNGLKFSCLLTKFQLFFLVRTSVKALGEALKVLEAPDVTNL